MTSLRQFVFVAVALIAIGSNANARAPIQNAHEAILRAPRECLGRIPKDAHWYARRERVNYSPQLESGTERVGHTYRFWHYDAWIVWFGNDPKGPECDAMSSVMRSANGQLLYCVHTNCAERGPPYVPPPPLNSN